MRRAKDFRLGRAVGIAGGLVLGWAAVQAWVLDSPVYAVATAVGALIGCTLSYFFFGWLKKKKSELQERTQDDSNRP